MKSLQGGGASGGVAFGTLRFYRHDRHMVSRCRVEDTAGELARFEKAQATAIAQLGELYEKALTQVGEQGAQIFEIHQMMLADDDYCDSIRSIVERQSVNAEYAVAVTGENFAKMFSDMDDAYMQGRAADVKDISDRLISVLKGETAGGMNFDEPVIIAADDLAPSETVQMDKSKILAFATSGGSVSSHTAILARTMGIPAIIGLGEEFDADLYDGLPVAVDGTAGVLYINPDEETCGMLADKQAQLTQRKRLLTQLKGLPGETKDGRRILTYANIGNPGDLGAVLANDAEGIGLFRSEFLYLESGDYPTENEQFQAYKTVAETMAGKRVIFRTLDIGADKQVDYFQLPKEENPAMGMRAIRICLSRPEIFRTQLRALYRASAYGHVAIMFPMISSVWEIQEVKKIAAQVRAELAVAGVPFDPQVELGIMVETPAAAILSNQLAREVDFFSIGTNDLIQYTTAADRQNHDLGRFYDPHHPAVMELIRMTVENAHRNGIWAGICGEMGADLSLTETFLAFGVEELSVAPTAVLPLREKIRSLSQEHSREILDSYLEVR